MDASNYMEQDDIAYLSSKDESYRVALGFLPGTNSKENKKNIEDYRWREGDFLLTVYPKCGTHLGWEIMSMLVNGNATYSENVMGYSLVDVTPIELIDKRFRSPRVVTTHYSLDVLPDDFQNKRTVHVIRNPKDAAVSYYYFIKHAVHSLHDKKVEGFTLDDYLDEFLEVNKENVMWGNYFKHVEYMWELSKTHSDMCVIFYEDIVLSPKENVRKLNEFMGIGCDDRMIQEIAEAVEFKKMKDFKRRVELESISSFTYKDSALAQANAKNEVSDDTTIFRKGKIGDWKNHFTVAMNERFDKYLRTWKPAQEIPFIYG